MSKNLKKKLIKGNFNQTDTRLVGKTAENIFLSLLNEKGIFSQSFDTACLDGVVFDLKRKYFKIGKPPFYVQIKCRGSKNDKFSSQGHSEYTIKKIEKLSKHLKIDIDSLYFVVGFYKNSDIRQIRYYIIPFKKLKLFKENKKRQYRFSISKCEHLKDKYSFIARM